MVGKKISVALLGLCFLAAASTANAYGASSGDDSLGVGLSLVAASQKDVNSWIDSTAIAGTKDISGGYEITADYEHRFSSTMYSMIIRPSYFSQSASGGGIEANMTGFTVFPMFRLYPLESSFIHFFMQVGLGYGNLSTELSNNGANGTFKGDAFGAIGGLGALFCFTPSHCLSIEGNFRYLPIERSTGTASGTLGGQITQANGELELNNQDLATTMSGIQGIIGYKMIF
jgi:hypothetical protein